MKKKILIAVLLFVLTGCGTGSIDTKKNDANIEHSDVYNQQIDLTKKYSEEIKEENPTIDNPKIIINPWGFNSLSAYIAFNYSESVSFEYVVRGKTENTDYTFVSEELSDQVLMPIVGLYYGSNEVDVKIKDKNNKVIETKNFNIDTTSQEIPEDFLKADVNISSDNSTELLDNKIILSAAYSGYDMEGDLRCYTNTSRTQYYHYDNNSIYTVDDEKNPYYIYKSDIMGVIKTEYNFPKKLEAHHDFTTDDKGNFYALATIDDELEGGYQEEGSSQNVETQCVYWNDKTGKLKGTFDMHSLFDENPIVASGVEFDPLHINAIEYNKQTNGLLMSSQAQSMLFELDADTFEINWIIDEPEDVKEYKEKVLSPIGEMIYTSGQHSITLNTNPKYENYRGDNKFVISVFNNNVCKNEEGEEYKTDQKSGPFEKRDVCSYADDGKHEYSDSQILVYGIDLDKFTVETLDNFELPYYSPIVSNVSSFETNDRYYTVFEGKSSTPTYLILDENGDIIYEMAIPAIEGRKNNYRGKEISFDRIETTFQ